MTKIDFKKEHRHLYQPSRKGFELLEVPPMQFLMIDGRGDPNEAPEYRAAVEALYAVSYTLKFMSKKELDKDYVVPPLEGLWWADDMDAFTLGRDKSQWQWTMMIMVPEWISRDLADQAKEVAAGKKDLPALPGLRCEYYKEGLSVQILHIGSYDDEAPTLERLHAEFMPSSGLTFNGHHHEIYLSDARRVPAEKLKTVLRQPVRRT